MNIFIVLINWNGWKDTVECLDSLFQSVGTNSVAVVCDNASKDGSLSELEAWATQHFALGEWVRLTRSEVEAGITLGSEVRLALVDNAANLGFGGGNNVGIRLAMNHSTCEYVWLLNNDTTVEPDALVEAVARMEQDPSIGLCGSTLVYFGDRNKVQAFGGARYSCFTGRAKHIGAFATLDSVPADSGLVENALSYVIGAAMLVRRVFIERVGYLRDDYFLYFEEIEWVTRSAGQFRLGYAPRSVVYHKEGASIGTDPSGGSLKSMYYLFRNRIWFTSQFHPVWLVTVFGACVWDILKMAQKGRIAQACAALRGIFSLPLPVPGKTC